MMAKPESVVARRLVIMAKEPVAGRVKTRLARDIGVSAATGFFRSNISATVARLCRERRWEMTLAVSPVSAMASPMLPQGPARMLQGRGDLGARLTHVCRAARAGPLVIIGGDIPGIRAADIVSAFVALRNADLVFGPSSDGGYWLIGLNGCARAKARFRDIRWSTAFALADTRAAFPGLATCEIAALDDVDDGDDYQRLASLAGRRIV